MARKQDSKLRTKGGPNKKNYVPLHKIPHKDQVYPISENSPTDFIKKPLNLYSHMPMISDCKDVLCCQQRWLGRSYTAHQEQVLRGPTHGHWHISWGVRDFGLVLVKGSTLVFSSGAALKLFFWWLFWGLKSVLILLGCGLSWEMCYRLFDRFCCVFVFIQSYFTACFSQQFMINKHTCSLTPTPTSTSTSTHCHSHLHQKSPIPTSYSHSQTLELRLRL